MMLELEAPSETIRTALDPDAALLATLRRGDPQAPEQLVARFAVREV
jgi:hypothetical protein